MTMKIFKTFILSALPIMMLFGCTQTQLGAHVGKQVFTNSQTQGTFKVGNSYKIKGKRYYPKETYNLTETGKASWYGPGFHGKRTANGETFNQNELTAAHRTLQMPSLIEVTNLENGKSVVLRVNDRGPFAHNRVLDVSKRGAELLGFKNQGVAKVQIKVLGDESMRIAQIAKDGRSTRGMETAYNRDQGRITPTPTRVAANQPTMVSSPVKVASVEQEVLYDPFGPAQKIPGKIDDTGRFLPAPVVKNTLDPSGQIYVQAGAFGDPNNARTLSNRLNSIASSNVTPIDVDGDMLHRVRLGPFTEMAQAQSVLNRVSASGQSRAIIVVD